MERFRDTVIIAAPIEPVFAWYTDLKNLVRMMPPDLRVRVVKADVPLRKGSRVRFAVAYGSFPLELTWEMLISEFEKDRFFADRQTKGPFDHWLHRHDFRTLEDGRTEVTDTLEIGAPMGFFGRMAEKTFVSSQLRSIFDHRRAVLRRVFEEKSTEGDAAPGASAKA